MKRLGKLFTMMALAALAVGCSTDDDFAAGYTDNPVDNGQSNQTVPGGSSSSGTALTGDLASFDVAIDTSPLSETDHVDADDEDCIENNSFDQVIKIIFSGNEATVSGSADGVTVTAAGSDVVVNSSVKGIAYELSGSTTDGSLKIYSDKKFALRLNDVSITNPTGAAINIQSGKRAYVVLVDGTTNTLTDGTSYTDATDGEDMKATLFSEGELLFSGSGSLSVYANCKNGICSDDYIVFRPGNNIYVKATKSNCIKSNDGIWVRGGVINCETSGTASKSLKTDGYVTIDGGRTTLIATGGGEYDADDKDTKASAGISTDSTFVMNDGELYCKSTGAGGKGVNADQGLTINGGTVRVVTQGARYTYGNLHSSPKGLKSDANLTINGGDVMVRCLGGEGSEGIESKATLSITGGSVASYCYDDAINAAKALNISGGYIYAYATNNDGIDSNGALTVSGGLAIACGTTQPEDGFDCDQNTFTITGGTLIGIGGGTSTPTSSTCKQAVAVVGVSSLTSGQYLTLAKSDGTNLLAFKLPRSYSQATVLVSSPNMQTGNSYTLASGGSVSNTTNEFYGYVANASVSGGTSLATFTQSSTVTTYNYSGGMGGNQGGGPGGPGGGRR